MEQEIGQIDDVGKSARAYAWKKYSFAFVLLALAEIGLLIKVYQGEDVFSFLVFPLVGSGALYAYAYGKVKHLFVQEFGASIGFSYAPSLDPMSLKGRLFSLGHSAACSDVLSGQYSGYPLRIFSYSYTVGSGKNQQTYSFTVFELTFKSKLPEMFLISGGSFFGSDLAAGEKLRLEGDFSDHFSLYVPQGSEQEAYEIFTPDTMAALLDKAQGLDFQFVEDRLYVYERKIIEKRTEMQSTLSLVGYLVGMMHDEIEGL